MFDYFKKNSSWILGSIAILISVCIPLVTIIIEHKMGQEKTTETYYFANSFNASQENVLAAKEADCWIRSLSSNRSDAFRCMSENYIYDPCFIDPFNQDIVVCPGNSIGDDEYFKAKIEKVAYDQPINQEKGFPWFIRLYNGRDCRFITGATIEIADKRMDYLCDGSDETDNFLLLPITKDNELLKINCMSKDKIGECDIKEAWY